LYGGGFNQALLRRLDSFTIHIAPLRSRREDIGLLLVHLLAGNKVDGGGDVIMPVGLVSRFLNYDWPGNIRQLRHVFKRTLLALQLGDMPDFDSLVDITPERITTSAETRAAAAMPTAPSRKKLGDISEQDVLAAMAANAWQIQGAAQALGVSRPSMYKLLETHSQIRRAEQISREEIVLALELCKGDVDGCAARLKTPGEALRRYLRVLGLGS
jgi:DNA-binding NtrC family response regulator